MQFDINEHGASVILKEAEKLLQQAQDKIEDIEKKMRQVSNAEVDKLVVELQQAQDQKQFAEAKIEEMKKLLDS